MRPTSVFGITALTWFLAGSAQADWRKLNTDPYEGKQDDIFFIDSKRGWYGNGKGRLYRTTDGGETWRRIWTKPGTFIRSIAFIDEKRGFLGNVGTEYYPGVTDETPLYRTEDGGKQWQAITELKGTGFKGVCSIDIDRVSFIHQGVMKQRVMVHATGRVGGPAYLARSLDGGRTWRVISLKDRASMALDVDFFDEMTGLVFASTLPVKDQVSALILRTEDGGRTWKDVYRSGRPTENVWKSSFPTREIGYATVQTYDDKRSQQVVVKTEDGGRTWKELFLVKNSEARQFGIGFVDENHGWVGTRKTGFETRDGGKTWKPVDLGEAVNRIRILKDQGQRIAYAIGTQVAKWTRENVPRKVSSPRKTKPRSR